MDQLVRLVAGVAGVAIVLVGLGGMVRVIARPGERAAVAVLETVFWFIAVVALGGLLILAGTHL